jgi:hypothetical protein
MQFDSFVLNVCSDVDLFDHSSSHLIKRKLEYIADLLSLTGVESDNYFRFIR